MHDLAQPSETDAATLAALDWSTVQCQCRLHKCTGTVSFRVQTHAIGRCNNPKFNADGNRVLLLCSKCLGVLRNQIIEGLYRLREVTPGIPQCPSCWAPIAELDHVLREVRPL
jgi:hypothetical protein